VRPVTLLNGMQVQASAEAVISRDFAVGAAGIEPATPRVWNPAPWCR